MSEGGGGAGWQMAAGAAGRAVGAKVWLVVGAVAVVALFVGLMALSLYASLGGRVSADSCVDAGTVGTPVSSGDESQQDIARIADQVATDMNLPGRAVLIVLMTGMQESGIRNLDYGDRDSLGWLQQRPSQGWGTAEQVRDVGYAARRFYEALRGVAGWPEMSLNDAAQAVQRSGFPEAYAKHEATARAIAAAIGADLTRAGDPYGTGEQEYGDSSTGSGSGCSDELVSTGPLPDGSWPQESATVCPDPTNGRGCITPRTAVLVDAIRSAGLPYVTISCWDAHAWNPSSDHSRGRACDLAYSSGYASGQALADGNTAANFFVQNAGTYGISYVIWQGRIWFARTGQWETYGGAGIYNPTSASGGHYDHVHVSLY